jgi:FkbM family methyltransferase
MKLALLDGDYEAPERAAVRKYLNPEWGVVELGACIGVVSCITNKLLRNPKAHVVVEINPLAIPHLQANRDRNGCSFRIVNAALAYDTSEVSFKPHFDLWANFLEQRGNRPSVSIPATQLQRLLAEENFAEFALICDIEGQEYELVKHEAETLAKAALIVMELHPLMLGDDRVSSLLARLAELGFRTIEKTRDVVVLAKSPKPLPTATPALASTSLSSFTPSAAADGAKGLP